MLRNPTGSGDKINFEIERAEELKRLFELLFRENFLPLCKYCVYKFHFEEETAKDIVHNAFIKLWENPDKLLFSKSPKSYLTTIVTNLGLDSIRHRQVQYRHQSHVLHHTILQQMPEADSTKLEYEFENAVHALPEQMRKVFILCRFENMKYAEAASHLKISVKTVETQMSRALARLRHKLSNFLSLSVVSSLLSIYY